MPEFYYKIFYNNKEWVQQHLETDPNYFKDLSEGQKPPILWIGCSDSRVSANEVTGTKPGEVFVHRNIANMVIHTDMSMLSVLDYAVNILQVRHVIICGHYGCGGINAALTSKKFGIIDNWLRHIKDVYRLHKDEIDALQSEGEKQRRMVELNVQEQVFDLAKTSIIQQAWANGEFLQVHGIIYDIANGILKDLGVNFNSNEDMDQVYRFEF